MERDLGSLARAFALGVMHGPAELLPISSSGHIELVPWLLRWPQSSEDPEVRKAFEVALHAGTAAALVITLRAEAFESLRESGPRKLAEQIVIASLPPAVIGLALERPVERYLGTPGSIAVGLIAGALVMAWADRRFPQDREWTDAEPTDAFWLGIAQSCALFPGVSRGGATMAANRMRHFTRTGASRLSRHVALPVIGGATGLKLLRLTKRGLPPGAGTVFAVGAGASFISTLGFTWVIDQVERDRSLLPYAGYRVALGSLVLRRLWRERQADA
jgi:undecaprenyl-diphosphatase